MRISAILRARLSPEEINELRNMRGKAGRPVGTKKFEEFDHKVIGLADLYLREHPKVSVKAAIRAIVEQCWNAKPVESRHDFYRQGNTGTSISSACQRIFARLREDLAEAYPIARHIEKRVRKTAQLK